MNKQAYTVKLLLTLCALCCVSRANVVKRQTEPEYCPAPDIRSPETIYESRDFPSDKFKEAFAAKGKEFVAFIEGLKEEVNGELEDEQREELTAFPACLYTRQCLEYKRVIYFWRLPFSRPVCWTIQPLIWTTCARSVPDFHCYSEKFSHVGFKCIQTYRPTPVWVFCEDGTFGIRVVNVASGCIAQQYFCNAADDPIVQ